MKLEKHLSDAHPALPKGIQWNASHYQITPVLTIGQSDATAPLGPEQILFGDQGDLAAIDEFPMPSTGGIAITGQPQPYNRFNAGDPLHLRPCLLGDKDRRQGSIEFLTAPLFQPGEDRCHVDVTAGKITSRVGTITASQAIHALSRVRQISLRSRKAAINQQPEPHPIHPPADVGRADAIRRACIENCSILGLVRGMTELAENALVTLLAPARLAKGALPNDPTNCI